MVEAATRPLADNAEIRLAAKQFLRENLRPTEDNDRADRLEKLTARWNEVDARASKKVRWAIAAILIAALSAILLIPGVLEIIAYGQHLHYWSDPIFNPPPTDAHVRVARRADPAKRLLLVGNSSDGTDLETSEALWRSDPDNPAFFAEYAAQFIRENDQLPPGYRDTPRRIDPTNAFFVYLEASLVAKGSVEEDDTKTSPAGTPPGKSSWKVLDQAKLDRAMDLLRGARNLDKFDSYSAEMLAARTASLKQERPLDHLDLTIILGDKPMSPWIGFIQLLSAIHAQAFILADQGQVQAFEDLEKDAEHFFHMALTDRPSTLIGEVIVVGFARMTGKAISEGHDTLGRSGVNPKWSRLNQIIDEKREARKKANPEITGATSDPRKTASIFWGESLNIGTRATDNPPPLTDTKLKPGRLVDHEIASRAMAMVTWLLILIALSAAFLHRFRAGAMAARLGKRYADLLDKRDWAWILGAGILLPLAFTLGVNRFTPLGGRDFSLFATGLLVPAGHFVGLWMLWLLLPPQLIRWRLARRAITTNFRPPQWLAWVAIISAAASVPVIGYAAVTLAQTADTAWMDFHLLEFAPAFEMAMNGAPALLWAAIGLFLLPTLWLCISIGSALLGGTKTQVHCSVSASALIPVYMLTLPILLLSILGFQASERFWFKRETLMTVKPGTPGWSQYEYEVTLQARKELLNTSRKAGFSTPPEPTE